jgi:hypothetical protein
VSFFDEGDEPTQVSSGARRQPRPRRPATASRGRGGPPDRQTLLLRQAAAVGIGLLVLILLIFGVRSCANSRKERALKDYNRDVTAVISDSDSQVGKPFFQLMSNGAREGDQLRVQVNQLRLAADEDVNRAKGFNVPDAMKPAQDNLLLALNLRADGLSKIADQIPRAQGRGQPSENAIAKIAGQMQQFSASDVIYKVRVAPFIKQGLDDEGITGQTIATSQFLPDIAWLSPQTVADRLGRSAGGGGSSNTAVAPGLHGHGLTSVAVGGVTLTPSPGVNRVPAGSGGPTFTVKFANQGDNDERDVRVTIRVRGAGAPISQTKTISQTKARSDATVSIPLGKSPPVGQAVTVEASIAGVPGETNTDNNKQSYTVIFQR